MYKISSKFHPAIEATISGGRVLKKYFGKELTTHQKTTVADFFTKADIESEEQIVKELRKHYPDYGIFAEERGMTEKESDYTFIVDPLDGSNNYIMGVPTFSINLGLLHQNDIIFAVVHCPMIDHTYYAEKGRGAYLNNTKIKVNGVTKINQSTVGLNFNYTTPKQRIAAMYSNIYKLEVKRIVRNWASSIDFSLLAAGKIESVINEGSELYDFLPGKLIAREAGAIITDYNGNDDSDENHKFVASCTQEVHKTILREITDKSLK